MRLHISFILSDMDDFKLVGFDTQKCNVPIMYVCMHVYICLTYMNQLNIYGFGEKARNKSMEKIWDSSGI